MSTFSQNKPNWPFPRVIVHRGGGSLAPENTLMGIEKSLEVGIPAVEFDAKLSADKVPMLMHDDLLTRTASSGDPTYEGKMITEFSAAELMKVDVGSYFDKSLSEVFIPTLEQVISTCLDKKVFMNIEIKPTKGYAMRTGIVVAEVVLKYLDELDTAGVTPLFSSYSFDALKAAKEVAPTIPRGLLIHKPLDDVENWRAQAKELEVTSLNVNVNHITKSQVQEINSLGYSVMCYTVNDLNKATELLEWGVGGLCTDRTDMFVELSKQLEELETSKSREDAEEGGNDDDTNKEEEDNFDEDDDTISLDSSSSSWSGTTVESRMSRSSSFGKPPSISSRMGRLIPKRRSCK